jgi:hypothetical protein
MAENDHRLFLNASISMSSSGVNIEAGLLSPAVRCRNRQPEAPRVWWSLSCAPGFARSGCPSVLTTRFAVCEESMDQPTTRRENASSTTAQYTLPSRVGCSVISVSHNRFGSVRAKSRFTRSSAVGVFGILRYFGRPGSPARPTRRITNSTVQRATVMFQPNTSSAWTRRAP